VSTRRPKALLFSRITRHASRVAVAAAALVLLVALSCIPEERHRVLTFFFDGVPPLHPEPKQVVAAKAPTPAHGRAEPPSAWPGQPARPTWSVHLPSEDKRQCGTCHDRNRSFQLVTPMSELCAGCHQKQMQEFPRMHGPVAVGDCGACHEPHQSRYPHLVRRPTPELCFLCHGPAPIPGLPHACPRPADNVRCTDCHHHHGGREPFYIVQRPPAAPSPVPPTPPPTEKAPE